MSLPKIRLERCFEVEDGLWRLDGAQERRLVRSLRCRPGDIAEGLLPDGEGKRLLMRLEKSPEGYFLRAAGEISDFREGVSITLLIGLLKADQFDAVLRASSELGIDVIIPLLCERSVPRIPPAGWAGKASRWQKLLDDGTSVSGAVFPPRILPPVTLGELDWDTLPDERYAAVISRVSRPISEARPSVKAAYAVGPEGDWSENELSVLGEHGFIPVTLGGRIMRAS
ncbi:MAG: RsmE family RNA methyltransferase, partial [Synergistaceae bacterium]|nr:RsmE family RNA methyltransferase [Synergistaceae bacterium]